MKSKFMIAGIVMGVGATAAGMFIKHYSDNKKLKVDKLKEKARKYDELECGQYLSNEEFVNSFYMLEKYLNEQDESETQYIMQELQEAREFFSNGHFIYETIIFILNNDIPDEDKLKSIRSFITKIDDIMDSYKEYQTRFYNNKISALEEAVPLNGVDMSKLDKLINSDKKS